MTPLSAAEWERFLETVNRPLDVQPVDPLWHEGEIVDRQFLFTFAGGQLTGAIEAFFHSTGAPPRPFVDPSAAWRSLVGGRVNIARVIDSGVVLPPRATVHAVFWHLPDLTAYEVNFTTTEMEEWRAQRPAVTASPDRWTRILDRAQTERAEHLGAEGQFQRARFLQLDLEAEFEHGRLVEVREMGFGDNVDHRYPEHETVWRDIRDGALNPLPWAENGRFGSDLLVRFRYLGLGILGHSAIFITPARRAS